MAVTDTLVDVLQRSLANIPHVPGRGRKLAATTPDDRVAAICAEIGETVLPRKLTFLNTGGGTLVMDAGGRRLIRVISVEPSAIVRAGDPVYSVRDDANLAAQMLALGRALSAFSLLEGEIYISSYVAEGAYSTGAVGFAPDKLYEAATTKAKVAAKPDPAPKPEAVAKFSPTEAMKAMIREKVAAATEAAATAAATNPGPVKAQPPAPARPSGSTRDDKVRAFFAAVQNDVSFCAILNRDGNVEAMAGKEQDDRILAFAADIMADLERWRKFTTEVISRSQIIVMRAGGIQNQSVAYFTDDYGVAIAIFVNTDLSRIFSVADKILKG